MAAPIKITREAVLEAALELVRQGKPCDARSLAGALGCSTQPIFRNFSTMQALHLAVLEQAHRRYLGFREAYLAASSLPPYKAMGMAYIGFARTEPALFRLLFMRSRAGETDSPERPDWAGDTLQAGKSAELNGQAAELFHLEMWAVVHGIAVMLATGYLELEEETVSEMLTDAFQGARLRWEAKK